MKNRATAAVVAIVLVALVGATLAAMSFHCTAQAARTRQLTAQAQLRQALIAGTRWGIEKLSAGTVRAGEHWTIALPTEVGDEIKLTTTVRAATPVRIELEIQAAAGRQQLSQTAIFESRGGQSQLTAARLGQ